MMTVLVTMIQYDDNDDKVVCDKVMITIMIKMTMKMMMNLTMMMTVIKIRSCHVLLV